MRAVFVSVFALSAFSTLALADVQSYCEVLAKDFANEKASDVDYWLISYRNAFSNCLFQYTGSASVGVAERKAGSRITQKAAREVVVVPARDSSGKKRAPILEPGSTAWNSYCAAKYASFNQATGTYKSYAGNQKPCLVPSK